MYANVLNTEDIASQSTYARNNGRVQLLPGENGTPYHMFSDAGRGITSTVASDAFKNLELNATGLLFMSPKNAEALQDGIRYQVYARTAGKHVIGRQSDVELATIMRSMFLQHGRNTTMADGGYDIDEVRRLNAFVIEYCVDKIIAEINIYVKYRDDISQLPLPMARGEYASNKGSRSLVQREF